MSSNSVNWDDLPTEILSNPEAEVEYDPPEYEYQLASWLIDLRRSTGLTQRELALRVKMKQSQIARIESGKQIPKLETIARLAAAAGYRVEVCLVPIKKGVETEIEPLRIDIPNDV